MQRVLFPISTKRYPLTTKANYFQQLRTKFPERANTDRSNIQQSSSYFQNNDNQTQIIRSRTPNIVSRIEQSETKHPLFYQKSNRKIRLLVRIRPLLIEESSNQCVEIINVRAMLNFNYNQSKTIRVEYQYQQTNFKFDNLLLPTCNQQQTFSKIDDFLADFLNGVSATIFAYGQTGAGKTYTIIGDEQKIQDRNKKGIIPRVLTQIIKAQNQIKKENYSKITISFFEVYNDKIFDLFSYKDQKKIYSSLQIKQDKQGCFSVPGLTQIPIVNERQSFAYLSLGLHKRSVGMTAFNNKSSRSHSIFSIHYQKRNKKDGTIVNAKRHQNNGVDFDKWKFISARSMHFSARLIQADTYSIQECQVDTCFEVISLWQFQYCFVCKYYILNGQLQRDSINSYGKRIGFQNLTYQFADRAKRAILDSRFLPKKVKSARKIKSTSPNPLISISNLQQSSSSKMRKTNQRDFSANNPSPSSSVVPKIGDPNNDGNENMSIKTIIKAYCQERETRIELERYIRQNDLDHKKQLNNLKLQNQQLFKQLNQIKGEFSMFNNTKKSGVAVVNANKRNQNYQIKQQYNNKIENSERVRTIARPIPIVRQKPSLEKKQEVLKKPKSILKTKQNCKYSAAAQVDQKQEQKVMVKHKSWLKRIKNNIKADNKKPEMIMKQSGRSNSTSYDFAKIQNLQQIQPYYHPQKHIRPGAKINEQLQQQLYYSSNHQINKPNDISSAAASSYFINNQSNYPLNTLHQFLDHSNLSSNNNKSPASSSLSSPIDQKSVNKYFKTKNSYRIEEYELITSKNFKQLGHKDANKKLQNPIQSIKQKKVRFAQKIINQHELDESMLERMQHNQKYNDDTIFQHISIFRNIMNDDESQQQKISTKSEQFKKTRSIQTQKQGMALRQKNQDLQIDQIDQSQSPSEQGKISSLQQEKGVNRRVKPSFSYNVPSKSKIIDDVLHEIKDERIKSFWNIPPMTPVQRQQKVETSKKPLSQQQSEKFNLNKFILPDDNHKIKKNEMKKLKEKDGDQDKKEDEQEIFNINSKNLKILENNVQQGQYYTQFLEQEQTLLHAQRLLNPLQSSSPSPQQQIQNSQGSQYLLSSIHEECFDRRPQNPLPQSQFSQDEKNNQFQEKNANFNFSDHQNDSGGSGEHPLKDSVLQNSKNILLSDTGNGINDNNNFVINLNSKNSQQVKWQGGGGGGGNLGGEQISLIAGSGCDATSDNGQHNTNNNTLTLGSISFEGGQIVNGTDNGFDAFINSDQNSIIIPFSNEQNSLIMDNNEKGDLFFS